MEFESVFEVTLKPSTGLCDIYGGAEPLQERPADPKRSGEDLIFGFRQFKLKGP
jgi:hypothetical protein